MSAEIVHYIRAFLFGITSGVACFYFFLYFKPIVEEIIGRERISLDLWWWIGITVSIFVGFALMLILI